MNNTLKKHAHSLRLSGLLESLDLRLQEAEANRLPYAQFLELLLHFCGRLRRRPRFIDEVTRLLMGMVFYLDLPFLLQLV